MQETPLFTIRYNNTPELEFGYTKLLPSYKRVLTLYRVLGFLMCIPIVANLSSFLLNRDEVNMGNLIFPLLFVVYMLMYPYVVKMRVKNRFQKDPSNKEPVLMMLYEDRLEMANSISQSSMQYVGIDHISETPIGIYLFLSDTKAISIPREAISEQALEFLKGKIGR